MKALIAAVLVAGLTAGATAWAQAPATSCEDEIGPLRYLVLLYGETRTNAEFEMARQRARADRAEAEVERFKRIADAWKKAAEESKSRAPADLPAGQNGGNR